MKGEHSDPKNAIAFFRERSQTNACLPSLPQAANLHISISYLQYSYHNTSGQGTFATAHLKALTQPFAEFLINYKLGITRWHKSHQVHVASYRLLSRMYFIFWFVHSCNFSPNERTLQNHNRYRKNGVAENNQTKPCKRSAAPASLGI